MSGNHGNWVFIELRRQYWRVTERVSHEITTSTSSVMLTIPEVGGRIKLHLCIEKLQILNVMARPLRSEICKDDTFKEIVRGWVFVRR